MYYFTIVFAEKLTHHEIFRRSEKTIISLRQLKRKRAEFIGYILWDDGLISGYLKERLREKSQGTVSPGGIKYAITGMKQDVLGIKEKAENRKEWGTSANQAAGCWLKKKTFGHAMCRDDSKLKKPIIQGKVDVKRLI